MRWSWVVSCLIGIALLTKIYFDRTTTSVAPPTEEPKTVHVNQVSIKWSSQGATPDGPRLPSKPPSRYLYLPDLQGEQGDAILAFSELTKAAVMARAANFTLVLPDGDGDLRTATGFLLAELANTTDLGQFVHFQRKSAFCQSDDGKASDVCGGSRKSNPLWPVEHQGVVVCWTESLNPILLTRKSPLGPAEVECLSNIQGASQAKLPEGRGTVATFPPTTKMTGLTEFMYFRTPLHRSWVMEQLHSNLHFQRKWWDYAGHIVRGMKGPGDYAAILSTTRHTRLDPRHRGWLNKVTVPLMRPGEPAYVCCSMSDTNHLSDFEPVMAAGNTIYAFGAFEHIFQDPSNPREMVVDLKRMGCPEQGIGGGNCLPIELLVMVFAREVVSHTRMSPVLSLINQLRTLASLDPVHAVADRKPVHRGHAIVRATPAAPAVVAPCGDWPGHSLISFSSRSSLDFLYSGKRVKKIMDDPNAKFITVEPWNGGWNNIRMSIEGAIILAYLYNRTLVLADAYPYYLLGKQPIHYSDMVNVTWLGNSVNMATRAEWEEWNKKYKDKIVRPEGKFKRRNRPGGVAAAHMHSMFHMTEDVAVVTNPPLESWHDLVFCFPNCPKRHTTDFELFRCGRPTYDTNHMLFLNTTTTIHFNQNLLTHWSANFWFTDPGVRYKVSQLIRNIPYVDPVYEAARSIIHKLGGFQGYSALHARRGELAYTEAKSPADVITKHMAPLYDRGERLYIVTDEPNLEWFAPLRSENHEMLFLKDFPEAKKLPYHLWGPVESVVGAHARKFIGTQFSTFTANIYKLRGFNGIREQMRFVSHSTPWPERPPYTQGEGSWCHNIWGREYQHSWAGLGYGDTLAEQFGIV